jgi:NAD(P)-dependent dehydrogenase (short-subunit alcohol dehydrogenase family)
MKMPFIDRIVNPPRAVAPAAVRRAVAGKVVLVTGASYGLGEATARKLAAAGARVLLVARTRDRLDALAAEIQQSGGSAHAYAVDLAQPVAVEQLVQQILAAHGGVDIVVSNAGKSLRRSLHLQYDRFHDFTRSMDVNYFGPVRLLLGLLPSMRERGAGHIVNVSTIGVRIIPGPRWGVYQSSKAAFDIWLRSVSPELAADGVSVSTIYMALMYTRMSAPTPIMRRLPGLQPEEAADLVLRAIVEKPRQIAPWWTGPAELFSLIARGPLSAWLGVMHRYSKDSASARGGAPPPATHPSARSHA